MASCWCWPRSSLLRVRDEGLFRWRAMGHRDERDD
jgi:hypothetical protein